MEELGELFSEGELALVVSGVVDDFRVDGRTCFDLRDAKTRTGIFHNCSGSAQIQSTKCNITVGVKVEIGHPLPSEPDAGIVEISVDCSANAHPKFEGRGGDDIAQEIVSVLNNSILPSIDRKSLCLMKGHKVFIIYIDVLILECSCVSQLIDLSALAIKAALSDTRVPKLIPDEEEGHDLILAPDSEEYCPVNFQDIPILITMTRIHDQYVADVTEEEAAAGIARLTLALDLEGNITYSKKSGSGSLHPDPLKQVLKTAQDLSRKIQSNFDLKFG